MGRLFSAAPMLQAPYAYFLERTRATELHDSQFDSHGDGLTATSVDEGGRQKEGAWRWLDGEFAGTFALNSR